MKIAIPITNNNQLDAHFGHAETFRIFEISDNKTISNYFDVKSSGCACKSSIAGVLATHGVKTILIGNIGEGAINVLNNVGINVIRGCSGNIDNVINDFLSGNLKDNESVCSEHGSHSHGCHNH